MSGSGISGVKPSAWRGENAEKKDVVIFGLGGFSTLLSEYINECTDWDIAAYTVEAPYVTKKEHCGKPVIPFESIEASFSPERYEMIIALGYKHMGETRKRAYCAALSKGYSFPNFIHPTAHCVAKDMGSGNIILETAVISHRSVIGDGNLIWNGCQLAHDMQIGSFNTICGSTVFGGGTTIGDNCFFGINSTVQDGIYISSYTLVGAHCYLSSSTKEGEAYLSEHSVKPHRIPSKKIMDFWMR